ncbi:MAG TPA: hypothetical protein DDW49_00445 [Deltaproteobacteria bacterium]|nr:hypothetical protein [Deltaproteobacteria bacterium]
MKNNGLELIEWFQSKGKSVFTVLEAQEHLKLPRKSILEILARLRRAERVRTLTDGLYVIIHPSERKHGIRPLHVIDALMRYCQLPYYVGLLSAADFWGAAHHKPQFLQVIVSEQRKLRRLKDLRIQLHVQKHFLQSGIVQKTVDTGPISISSPELTALDVLTYESSCGGFDNVTLIVNGLQPQLGAKKIIALGKEYPVLSSFQRLGFLLESFNAKEELLNPLRDWVKKQNPSPILLLVSAPREGKLHPDWKIFENVKVGLEE